MQIWRPDDRAHVPSRGQWWSTQFRRFSRTANLVPWVARVSSLQWDVQFCRYGPATVLIAFVNNKMNVIMQNLVEFHPLTKILLTLRKITKKITKNFQLPKKFEKSRKITKSNLNKTLAPNLPEMLPKRLRRR